MEWLIEHGEEIILILLAVHGLASAITALTPTPKKYGDALAKFYRLIEVIAGLVGHAKEEPEKPAKPPQIAPDKIETAAEYLRPTRRGGGLE